MVNIAIEKYTIHIITHFYDTILRIVYLATFIFTQFCQWLLNYLPSKLQCLHINATTQ